jgi:transposase
VVTDFAITTAPGGLTHVQATTPHRHQRPGQVHLEHVSKALGSSLRDDRGMGDRDVLSDGQWARIEGLLPPQQGVTGRPQAPHRRVVEGIVFRYRAGIPWRDLPPDYGPWQTVWKRHHKWSGDGTWDRVLAELLADADAEGELDWRLSVDSSVVRAHQHGTNARRDVSGPSSYTGGGSE